MNKIDEDDLLKHLFGKIKLEKVPDNFTSGIMDQIMVNPEIETVKKFYFEWWWIVVGTLSILSIYLSGVYSVFYRLLWPYFVQIFQPFLKFFLGLYELIPSNIVALPTSVILPAVLAGIIFILSADVMFRSRMGRITAIN